MPSDDNFTEDAAKGAIKGGLEWTKEEAISCAKKLVTQFKNRDINFIGEAETIKLVFKQDSKGEFTLFKSRIKNRQFRILFRLGLTLRELEGQPEKQSNLNRSIYQKFDLEGLHISHLVQNGVFSWYISSLLERGFTDKKVTKEIEHLFNNIEQVAYFVQQDDDPIKKAKEISTKINVGTPLTFIISSIKSATNCCEKIRKLVLEEISNYDVESIESKDKKVFLLTRIPPSF